MPLEKSLNEGQFNELSDSMKELYLKDGDVYNLDVVGGFEDVGALRRGKDRASQELKEAKGRALAAEKKLLELSKLDDNDARKRGDIEKLDKSWQDKINSQKEEYMNVINQKDEFISKTLTDVVAHQIASEISTYPNVILPHIKSRLKADLDSDTPSTRVLDESGNITSLTTEELKKEFIDNKEFSAIITANKASGGGASTDDLKKVGSASIEIESDKRLLSEMNPKELVAAIQSRKKE